MELQASHTPNPDKGDFLNSWLHSLKSTLRPLRQLAGDTEREFLQIGSRMQKIHQLTINLSGTANELVEVASGERLCSLTEQLKAMLAEMDSYLEQAQAQSEYNRTTLDSVSHLLRNTAEPLTGVKRMCKHLYMLEVSIKIESAYLGEMGSEFINLAIDIKKLSQQIKEKVNAIQDLSALLTNSINHDDHRITSITLEQDNKAAQTCAGSRRSIEELESVNARFSQLGAHISTLSEENSESISTIVQSMQCHDIYRQQVEHVLEALEGLLAACPGLQSAGESGKNELIGKIGDVCELQQAQLQFPSSSLYSAVGAIVTNLNSISGKQQQLADEIFHTTGMIESSGTSFIENISLKMLSLTGILSSSADKNTEVAKMMKDVTGTIGKITGFVTDIEEIGGDIIQIALNSRIKAASAGREGASLSVLAEEIGHLSNDTVERTDVITKTLAQIDSATHALAVKVQQNEDKLSSRLTGMKVELDNILAVLGDMGDELMILLTQLTQQSKVLSKEITLLTSGIDVHNRAQTQSDSILATFEKIFTKARELQPASKAFKDDLRLMAQRYTMESERRIHESIANKHGVGRSATPLRKETKKVIGDTDFGDNVDLF